MAPLPDIVSTYAHALLSAGLAFIVWAVIFRLITSRAFREWFAASSRGERIAGTVLLLVAALAWAWHLRSLFDDAYISLRYAQNLVGGHGLVFNPGERVEGYTNFLWTLILAGAMEIGFDGPRMAIFGCLLAFAAELLLLIRIGRLISRDPTKPAFPWAALLLGGSYTFATFGTSGMETMLSTLLLTCALERALSNRLGMAGLGAILAVMTHPDFAIFYVGLGFTLLLDKEKRSVLWRYALPFFVVYGPYFAWRWHYYGDLLPNTFYAKSGGSSYFSQGAIYLLASGLACGLWALFPFIGATIRQRPRDLLTRFALFGVVPYLFYVFRLGGDFMLGRLIVPVLPTIALLAQQGMEEALASPASTGWMVFLLPALALSPVHLLNSFGRNWGLSDERTYYRVTQLWPEVDIEDHERTEMLRALVEQGVRPVIADIPIGREGYITHLPIVDVMGLTDRNVAHQVLRNRGRPGHEKEASRSYLRSREVEISIDPLYPEPYAAETVLRLGHQGFYLGRYEPRLVKALEAIPDVDFVRFPQAIDDYLERASRDGVRKSVARDLAFFDAYYFSLNPDPARRARLQDLMAGESAGR